MATTMPLTETIQTVIARIIDFIQVRTDLLVMPEINEPHSAPNNPWDLPHGLYDTKFLVEIGPGKLQLSSTFVLSLQAQLLMFRLQHMKRVWKKQQDGTSNHGLNQPQVRQMFLKEYNAILGALGMSLGQVREKYEREGKWDLEDDLGVARMREVFGSVQDEWVVGAG